MVRRRLPAAVRSWSLADDVFIQVAGNVVPEDPVVIEVIQDGEAVFVTQVVVRLWPASPWVGRGKVVKEKVFLT